MVGGFPRKQAPAPKPAESVAPEAEFDEDDRLVIKAPLTPAATRPPPTTYARPLPPMPGALRPGALPPMPPRPVAPTVKREGPLPLPPPKAATPAPTTVKPPPPPTPYMRKQQAQYLDPETIPFDKPRTYGVRR